MPTRRPTCTCSDMQLNLVGCDCAADHDAVIVKIFIDGYASDNKDTMVIDGGLDPATEVRKKHGSFARIYETRPLYTPIRKAETFSPEYIREMSKGG